MKPGAILLLCLAALIHASWNLLAKKGRDPQVFIWLSMGASSILLLAPAARLFAPAPPAVIPVVLVSACLEAVYVLLLGAAYASGEFSVVYPIARGSAPLFVAVLSFLLRGETLSPSGAAGVLLVTLGLVAIRAESAGGDPLTHPPKRARNRTYALALATGAAIGGYSSVDRIGVTFVDPIAYVCAVFAVSVLLLAPYMVRARRDAVAREWGENRRRIVAVGAMTAASYVLVLFAMRWNRAAYVSAVREVSVVFAALLGAATLRERLTPRKLVGAAVIFVGIVLIGLSR